MPPGSSGGTYLARQYGATRLSELLRVRLAVRGPELLEDACAVLVWLEGYKLVQQGDCEDVQEMRVPQRAGRGMQLQLSELAPRHPYLDLARSPRDLPGEMPSVEFRARIVLDLHAQPARPAADAGVQRIFFLKAL